MLLPKSCIALPIRLLRLVKPILTFIADQMLFGHPFKGA
jgi:hypothetical protein